MNLSDINNIVKSIEGSSDFKKFIKKEALDPVSDMARKYAKEMGMCLIESVNSSSHIGPSAKSALSRSVAFRLWNDPVFYYLPNSNSKVYQDFEVFFDTDLHRDSVAPNRYPEGVDDIAKLLNNGYSASHEIVGNWHGHKIRTLAAREGAHFVSEAKSKFLSKHPKGFIVEVQDGYYDT